MTSPIEPRTASLYHASRAPAVEPSIAAAIVLAALATYLAVAGLVPQELAVPAAQAALAVVPIAAVMILHPTRPLAALGLRRTDPRLMLAALAIGATAWYVNVRIVSLLPLPAREVEALETLVGRTSLLQAFATFALVPALCEEVLFRGVLARALGRRLPLFAAAAISAVVFSAYHLSLVQALPTLLLGMVFAVIAIRADSVLPAMLAHVINNGIAIAISRGELAGIARWLDHNPTLALVGCSAATGAGFAIALRGPARPGDPVGPGRDR
jgi:membrane protease YdiL (CAAX protease family)